jgi:putative Holliday junction resolvase
VLVTPDEYAQSMVNIQPDKPPRSILALDFGTRRIGVATGSCITGTASALTTLSSVTGEPNWSQLEALLKEWMPDLIALGLPFNSDGSDSEMTRVVHEFADELKTRFGIPVELVDERYTSAEAEALLKEQRRRGIRTKKLKKEDVDAVAAQLIAESWLNTTGKQG